MFVQKGEKFVQDRHRTYYVTLWRVGVNMVAMETQECILCVDVELHFAAKYIEILRCTIMILW
jgi:hypothetical protein